MATVPAFLNPSFLSPKPKPKPPQPSTTTFSLPKPFLILPPPPSSSSFRLQRSRLAPKPTSAVLKDHLGRVSKTWSDFTNLNHWVVLDYYRLVNSVDALEPKIQSLSDEQLTAKTGEFRRRLRQGETLADIQAEAFAVVREAARRKLGMRHFDVQDFSHVHTFRGHEHRVTALVYVDEEQLCISGDNSGGIFVWAIRVPFGQDPIKKWYEEKDWRYSGIHALTISGNGYLYTGSGDKSIKAWSLKDGALYCTMNGHKSVVSTLAGSDGVLYSGSWDGTIRLWSLNDHSALAVLGEDIPGNVTSVLSLTADGDMLIASFENGCIKVWRNDVLMKSVKLHQGVIFTTGMEGKWLFTGGWDKILKVQELLDDEFQIDITPTGSIPCGSVITALLCWQGKLIVGYADRSIKVYFYGK